MPPKKRDNSRVSGQSQGSSVANGNSAQRKPSSSSDREGLPPRRPTETGSPIGHSPRPVSEVPTANNEFGTQEVGQPVPGLQPAPYANNVAHSYAPALPRLQGEISEDEYIRSVRLRIPPPPVPGRMGQTYCDARDYLTREQQEALAGVSISRGSSAMRPDRGPVNRPSQYALEFNGGPLSGRLLDGRSNGRHPDPNSSSFGTANGTVRSQAVPNPSTTRSGRKAGLFPSTARLNHLIDEVPDTPSPRGRANRDRAGTSQPPKSQKARKFSDRDSTPPTPSFKRGRLIEDITDQEEGETHSQALVVYNENPSNDAVPRYPSGDPIYGDSSHPFKPHMANAATNNPTSSLSDPFMGSVANERTVEVPAPVMAPPRRGIIMADNYNIFNPSLMARVAAECENNPYMNTPAAISTYHQMGMADDLFYGGIWRGMFIVNGGHIIEYDNPAPRRPEVHELLRRDRRLIMSRVKKSVDKTSWYSVINGKALLPTGAEGMEDPPAEYQNTLDLLKYFYIRVPCAPSIDRYAELVAPLHVDWSPEANNENMAIVGMTPGSNPVTAALRLATPAEASSDEAKTAIRHIPAVRFDDPPFAATETPAAPAAPVNVGMAPSASAALLSPVGTSMAPNATGTIPGYLDLFPDLGVASSASATPAPPVDSTWYDPSGFGLIPYQDIAPNAPSASGATLPLADTHTAQDTTGLEEYTTLGDYENQDLVPYHPSESVHMPPFENSSTSYNITGSSNPAYPNTSQDPGAILASTDTVPSLPSPNDILIATATVSTSAAALPLANTGTTSAAAGLHPGYLTPSSNPGLTPNTTTMPAAFLAPVSDGRNLDIVNSNPRNHNAHWGSTVPAWLKEIGTNNEDSSSNSIDPITTNLGVADIPTTSTTANDDSTNNVPVRTYKKFGSDNPVDVIRQSDDRNPPGSNTFASNEQPTGGDELINGVLFSNRPIADDHSDQYADSERSDDLLSDNIKELLDIETDEDEEVEEIDGQDSDDI
ncbi:hypothetical protein F5B21DRAFT_522734 [Xylaria acuta]|nr:hypothetical protein F5B21DRAFT_522734 [Xylaria acuta]